MENQTIVLPTNNIEGNITICKIENQEVAVLKNTVFSVTEKHQYISYDVCNKQIIKEYTVPQFTGLGFISMGILIVVVVLVIWDAFDSLLTN